MVLPEDSVPKSSVTLPLGIPPIPNAKSKEIDPVGIELVLMSSIELFSVITVPAPNSFSI